MSTKSVLRDLMPENEDAGFQKDTITLSNGATIEVEPHPVYEGTQWLWRIDGQIFSVDAYAENFLRRRVIEKLTGKRILLRAKGKVPEICGNICPHPEHDRALCDYCPIAEAAAADEDGLELVYAAANPQEEALAAILTAVEDFGFGVTIYEEDDKGECGFEIEDWTPNGVDMVHLVDLREEKNRYDPFALLTCIRDIAEGFDSDDEVEVHMEDGRFRKDFTYREAAEEFEGWRTRLEELVSFVEKAFKKAVPGLEPGMEFSSSLSYKKILEEV